jgi:hypothetical protein
MPPQPRASYKARHSKGCLTLGRIEIRIACTHSKAVGFPHRGAGNDFQGSRGKSNGLFHRLPHDIVTYIQGFRYYIGKSEQQAIDQFQRYL